MKNPRRIAAGKRNRELRKSVSDETRELLRQAALRNKPWRFSTGPRTQRGKLVASANSKARTKFRDEMDSITQARELLKRMRTKSY